MKDNKEFITQFHHLDGNYRQIFDNYQVSYTQKKYFSFLYENYEKKDIEIQLFFLPSLVFDGIEININEKTKKKNNKRKEPICFYELKSGFNFKKSEMIKSILTAYKDVFCFNKDLLIELCIVRKNNVNFIINESKENNVSFYALIPENYSGKNIHDQEYIDVKKNLEKFIGLQKIQELEKLFPVYYEWCLVVICLIISLKWIDSKDRDFFKIAKLQIKKNIKYLGPKYFSENIIFFKNIEKIKEILNEKFLNIKKKLNEKFGNYKFSNYDDDAIEFVISFLYQKKNIIKILTKNIFIEIWNTFLLIFKVKYTTKGYKKISSFFFKNNQNKNLFFYIIWEEIFNDN